MGRDIFFVKELKGELPPSRSPLRFQEWLPAGKWIACSDEWLASGGVCILAPRLDCSTRTAHYHPPVPQPLICFGDDPALLHWVSQNVEPTEDGVSAKVLFSRRHLELLINNMPLSSPVRMWGLDTLHRFNFKRHDLYFVAIV